MVIMYVGVHKYFDTGTIEQLPSPSGSANFQSEMPP
jgi:hypothetical protein